VRTILRVAAGAVFIALLAGCSTTRITYNNAEPLVRFMAHDYFDLDERQSEQFRRRLEQFHDWHRSVELPAYVSLLEATALKARSPVTRADLTWAAEALRSRYRALLAKAAEDAAPILVTLTPPQIAELEKRLAKANAKYAEEFVSGDEERAHRARFQRMLKRFSDWTGDLTDLQEARIERFVKAHARVGALRLEDRRRWHGEAVALIRGQRNAQALALSLGQVFTRPEAHRTPEYAEALARWDAGLVDLVLDIDRTLSKEQRTLVVRNMERYAEDFRVLSGSLRGAAAGPR